MRDARQDSRVLLLDLGEVPLIDATAIDVLDDVAAECLAHGCAIIVAGLQSQPRAALARSGFLARTDVQVAATAHEGALLARQFIGNDPSLPAAVPDAASGPRRVP